MKNKLLSRAAVGTLVFYFLFIAWIGWLYPVTSDDYTSIVTSRSVGFFSEIQRGYTQWGIRFAAVPTLLLSKFDRTLFNFLNPFVQLALALLCFFLVFNRKFNWRKPVDCLVLILLILLLFYGGGRPRDTVFWLNGAVTYSWSVVILLGFFSCFRSFFSNPERPVGFSLPLTLALFPFGLIAGFGNENNTVGGAVFLAGLAAFARLRQRRLPGYFYSGTAGFLLGGLLLLGAPGLRIRYRAEAEANGSLSLLDHLQMIPETAAFWLYSSWLALTLLLLFLAVWAGLERQKIRQKDFAALCRKNQPVVAALLIVGLSFLMALAFCAGRPPAIRAYFSCFILNGIATAILARFLLEKHQCWKLVGGSLLLPGMFLLLVLPPAIPDILAIRRDQRQREQRIAEQKADGRTDLLLPPHRTQRRSLFHYIFVEDFREDPEFWLNRSAARYYQVNSIRTTEPGTGKTFWKAPEQ